MTQIEVFKETIIRNLFKGADSSLTHSLYFLITLSPFYHYFLMVIQNNRLVVLSPTKAFTPKSEYNFFADTEQEIQLPWLFWLKNPSISTDTEKITAQLHTY